VLQTRPPRTGGVLFASECPDVAACLGATPRLWVVRVGRQPDPLTGIGPTKEGVLRRRFQLTQLWYPKGLTLALLERRPATP
jgi:mannosyltransferase